MLRPPAQCRLTWSESCTLGGSGARLNSKLAIVGLPSVTSQLLLESTAPLAFSVAVTAHLAPPVGSISRGKSAVETRT